MIRRVMQCETCGKQVDLPLEIGVSSYYKDMPETWLALVEGNPQASIPWHFCSVSHLYQWSSNRLNSASTAEQQGDTV